MLLTCGIQGHFGMVKSNPIAISNLQSDAEFGETENFCGIVGAMEGNQGSWGLPPEKFKRKLL